MRKRKNGESLVGIIVGITILAFTILGIMSLIFFSHDVVSNFNQNTDINLLRQNANIIAMQLNTSSLINGETFYVYKNSSTKTFTIFTGATNIAYKYVDALGDNVNTGATLTGSIYERTFLLVRTTNPAGASIDTVQTNIIPYTPY